MASKAKEKILAASNKVMPPVVEAMVYSPAWNSQRCVASTVLSTLIFRLSSHPFFLLPFDASIPFTPSTEENQS